MTSQIFQEIIKTLAEKDVDPFPVVHMTNNQNMLVQTSNNIHIKFQIIMSGNIRIKVLAHTCSFLFHPICRAFQINNYKLLKNK